MRIVVSTAAASVSLTILFLLFGTCPHHANAQVNWDPYAPTTHSITLPVGDYVEVTVQGLSHVLFSHDSTYWVYTPHPKRISLLTVWGHYSNKQEPYVVTGHVIPGSGSRDGWFRSNALNIYVYTNCTGSQAWMNYIVTNALPIWKPEQSGELHVTGSGGYLPDCPVHWELAKLVFSGSEPEVGVVREIYIDIKKGRPLPPAPPDEPGDPDFEFRLDYNDRNSGPPGEDWPPLEDDWPPYDGYGGGLPDEPENAGRPLEVVGSAATGARRGVGTDLPIGKGPGTRSDIDFLVPPSSRQHFVGFEHQLPSIDPRSGIIPGVHNPQLGPAVRFEPGRDPFFIPGDQ